MILLSATENDELKSKNEKIDKDLRNLENTLKQMSLKYDKLEVFPMKIKRRFFSLKILRGHLPRSLKRKGLNVKQFSTGNLKKTK